MPEQPPQYPGFEMSIDSLRLLHQELGRRVHECIERELREQRSRQQMAMLATRPTPESAAAVNGVLAEDEMAVPADLVPLRSAKRGGGG